MMTQGADLFGYPEGLTLIEPMDKGELVYEFILAGNAKFSIKSNKTGKHFTFKVRKDKDTGIWYVSRLTSDNEYLYLGAIFKDDMLFRTTRRTGMKEARSEAFRAFDWFWLILNRDKTVPTGVTFYHVGRCGMCGLELTDPTSIKEGYGPDCSKKRLRRSFGDNT